jgi:hypothetical protein
MVLSVGISIPTFAEVGENAIDFDSEYAAIAVMLSDYLIQDYKVEELVDEGCCQVKIVNENNELVRFGKADNEIVVNLINKSDFLVQINDTKYYRLN